MPGIGEVIEGAMQQAAQPSRHSTPNQRAPRMAAGIAAKPTTGATGSRAVIGIVDLCTPCVRGLSPR